MIPQHCLTSVRLPEGHDCSPPARERVRRAARCLWMLERTAAELAG